MRNLFMVGFTLMIAAGVWMVSTSTPRSSNPHMSDSVPWNEDSADLTEFLKTIDRDLLVACVNQYDASGVMDLDKLAESADFDLYARYMRVSKLDAVKKFESAVLRSSSRLEFEDDLAR